MILGEKKVCLPLIYSILLIISLFIMVISTASAVNFNVRSNLVKAANIRKSGDYTFSQCRALRKKPFDAQSTKKKILIIGDSQSCDFINGIVENNFLKNYQISMRFIPYKCQTIVGDSSPYYIKPQDRKICENPVHADSLERSMGVIQQADLVIYVARWKPEIAKRLSQSIEQFALGKNQKMIVIGSKFFGKISIKRYLHMEDKELITLRNDVGTVSKDINDILESGLDKGVEFIDQHELICVDSTTCPVFTNDLRLISYDGRHLTKEGARYVGKVLFQKSGLGHM
ncbi:MAG TPA: SGNH/GDSL hydrolase family protein [Thiothrix sp.]|nr:SGNH/GDSL hydrolase family protein [Thiothrix sp.]